MPRFPSDHSCDLQAFPCKLESCEAVFTRSSDRDRHERRHLPYTQRPFKCDFCEFRANQKSGLKCHENSVHLKKRVPCRHPGCDRDFSDPSTLSRHMNRRHKLSSKKRSLLSCFTSTFAIRTGSQTTLDATVAHRPDIQKFSVNRDHTTKVERTSPDVSSANITLHTGRQEGFSRQNPLLDSAPFSFEPSPTLSPLLGNPTPYQPDWQFQSSSVHYSSGSAIDFTSNSTAMLPELSLNTVIPPSGFQIGFDAYGAPSTSKPAEQSVDTYFRTLLEIPVDNFLAQSSTNSFAMASNTKVLPVQLPSLMLPPPMTNYDATCPNSDLLCDSSQRWQVDTPALNFGYEDPLGTEYYSRFSQFNGSSSFNF